MTDELFRWPVEIATFDCDRNQQLRPSAQLKLQQEIGEKHLNQLGLDYQALYSAGVVFVLTNTASRVIRPPRMSEQVEIVTWSRGYVGAQFYRCYDFYSREGELLVSAMSAFAIIDPTTHRLLRPAVFTSLSSDLPHLPQRMNLGAELKRIPVPDELGEAVLRPVVYTDIDFNQHLNNAVYADLICDYWPGGLPEGRFIGQFHIQFANSAVLGDELSIYTMPGAEQQLFIGQHGRGLCFAATARLDAQ